MSKSTTQKIKGIAILIMIAHHFIIIPFLELPHGVTVFGYTCKICVAIYAVLSGYGYYFAKEKTIKYGLLKIWGLLKIYWISLFILFIPIAMLGGWKLTFEKLVIQLFGLLPNLNWFAWYVFFYIFCMLVMPLLCKYRVFRYKPWINLLLMLFVPYFFEIVIHILLNYTDNIIIQDLYSCFIHFPCFLMGYWMAENNVIKKLRCCLQWNNSLVCLILLMCVFGVRSIVSSVAGFLLDVIYAPIFICCVSNLLEKNGNSNRLGVFNILGKYSAGMWFFHAVFFSPYIKEVFQPLLMLITNPLLMFIWMVVLSLVGAILFQALLDILYGLIHFIKAKSK